MNDRMTTPAIGMAYYERIDAVGGSREAAKGAAANLALCGWRVAGRVRRAGQVWYVPMRRERENDGPVP